MPVKPKYKRILLKLSGEALIGEGSYGISRPTIEEIRAAAAAGTGENIVISRFARFAVGEE